jgi:hypothetical protein
MLYNNIFCQKVTQSRHYMKYRKGVPTKICEFREVRLGDSHTLRKGVNKFLLVLSLTSA